MDHLQRKIGGLVLEHPIYNGAGECKLLEGVQDLARSASSAILVGSITKEARPGNDGKTIHYDDFFALNSLGIPNPGLTYYDRFLGAMASTAHDVNKPLIVSVAAIHSSSEYVELATAAEDGGADAVELNFGCPNLWDGGKQKRILSFDLEEMRIILLEVRKALPNKFPIFVKLSPYSDPVLRDQAATLLKETGGISAVVLTNTFPNAFAWDEDDKQAITPARGLAGMSGPVSRPIGLGHVVQFESILKGELHMIGVGGISSGKHVREYLRAGASAVQVATYWMENGSEVFSEILGELVELEEKIEEAAQTQAAV